MEFNSDIAIISAFGRGHWLAVELAKLGIPVSLLDVTGQLGRWSPEDFEGPFGFFKSSEIRDSQWERMLADDPPHLVTSGFTFWLAEGPLELQGPSSSHRLQNLKVPEKVQKYVTDFSVSQCPVDIKKMAFSENWLAQFSHSFAAVVSTAQAESLQEGWKQDLFSSLYIRQVTRQGFEKSLQWCRDHGVHVKQNVQIKDLSFNGKNNLAGLEVRTEKLGIFKSEKFVWCMSSEETSMLGSSVLSGLFPAGTIEPEWVWIRYRFRIETLNPRTLFCLEQLPLHCVLIAELNLPWVEENMVVLQRTTSSDLFDAWIRIPNLHRFQRQYLDEKGVVIAQFLEKRIPEHEIKVVQKPIETELTFNQLGPSRHPIFSRAARTRLKYRELENVFFDSPEQWLCLGWKGNFKNQEKILGLLRQWWNKKEDLKKKREAKEVSARSPGPH